MVGFRRDGHIYTKMQSNHTIKSTAGFQCSSMNLFTKDISYMCGLYILMICIVGTN